MAYMTDEHDNLVKIPNKRKDFEKWWKVHGQPYAYIARQYAEKAWQAALSPNIEISEQQNKPKNRYQILR